MTHFNSNKDRIRKINIFDIKDIKGNIFRYNNLYNFLIQSYFTNFFLLKQTLNSLKFTFVQYRKKIFEKPLIAKKNERIHIIFVKYNINANNHQKSIN